MEFVDGESCAEILRDHGPLGTRDAVNDARPGLPRAGLRAPQRRRAPRRQAGQPAAQPRRRRSSSPTSASPRRPSSPTSRRPARCSAPRPTSRPSRRAASRPAPPRDLYALGVVSYQLLAGRLPYEAASLTDLARLQETAPPPRLDELNPDVPPPLAEAIMVALHRDPERRYADAADMEQALVDALHGGLRRATRKAHGRWTTRRPRDARRHAGDDRHAAARAPEPAGSSRSGGAARAAVPEPAPAARRRRPAAAPPQAARA